MALTETYVDPSIAGDSGSGTVGDPYGDLEYCLEQMTRDGTNGDRINIKAGTDEVLEFALDIVADYGTPTLSAPLVFQGYTSAAGDNGIGGISGGGSVSIVDLTALDYVGFVDMHLHNTGAAQIIDLDQYCYLIRCELDNSSNASRTIELGANGMVVGCHIHNIEGALFVSGCLVMFNFFDAAGANTMDSGTAFAQTAGLGLAYRNIYNLSGSALGINLAAGCAAISNAIFHDGAAIGDAIEKQGSARISAIINNIMHGGNGTGSEALRDNSGGFVGLFAGNSQYNYNSGFDAPPIVLDDWKGIGNETLGASPFTDAAGGDFSPVDTGSIKEGSIPDDFAGQ